MYGVRMQMPDAPMLRRTFHALVAMFQAAHNCDFYITKYHAKPMAQLQSLFTNIALGLRRLEAEDEAATAGPEQPAQLQEDRARRTTLKIANAANRSSWCSCCEMATFIKTGALARRTHRPIAIFLSRQLYLYEQCRRFLQSSHEMVIEAQAPCDDDIRHLEVLCFTESHNIDSAVLPVALQADDCDPDSAAPPVEPQVNAEPHDRSVHSGSSDAGTISHDDIDPEGSDLEESDPEGSTAEVPELIEVDNAADCAQDDLNITAFEATTSAHDDWLHRGPFLFEMDFHTYMRFAVRKPRPKKQRATDADRAEHHFLFDAHYALAETHWQQLVTEGVSKLVVMEALRCPPPGLNNGEDNAVFKSLIGTLIRCPGPGQCADPLFCKPGFFQVTVPEFCHQDPRERAAILDRPCKLH